MKRLVYYFSKRYLPRWLIISIDFTILTFSWFLSFLLRFNFDLPQAEAALDIGNLVLIYPVFFLCFLKTKSFSGILRHSTTKDIMNIISSNLCAGGLLIILSLTTRIFNLPSFMVLPLSVIIIMVLVSTSFLVLSRLVAKGLFAHLVKEKRNAKKIMIFGAGRLGQTTRNALLMDTSEAHMLIGFIDDNPSLYSKYSAGIPIYSFEKALNKIIPENQVTEIIIAIEQSKITHQRKREITDQCLKHKLIVKEVPPVKTWINGELHARAIRRVNIEDLLGRDSIHLDRKRIERGLKNSVVLVTGAAGSIGSEIVRQLIAFHVKQVILFDKAESDLYDLQQEIRAKKNHSSFEIIVGDVNNKTKLRRVFLEYAPSIVFNAAAYKHVPLMEQYPCEAIRVNVGGTRNLADLSIEFGVDKFVFISSDKAVNPTNVMGASKRISEIYIQSLAQSPGINTKFITTRFGNVLGSNGSVVPLFKKQIERGGPVTVTHKDITRYFMTIPEACQLVLEAGFMGKGGEIFVFDMGEPVKIFDLAKKMISLSGFVPHQDIEIKITDLRPGEKLYEELLDNTEEMMPTHNDKIMIGKVRKHEYKIVNEKITNLLRNLDEKERWELVEEMMHFVPEFISTNSNYKKNNGKTPKIIFETTSYH